MENAFGKGLGKVLKGGKAFNPFRTSEKPKKKENNAVKSKKCPRFLVNLTRPGALAME